MDIVNKYNYINNPNSDLISVLKLALNDFGQEFNCVRVGIVQEFLYDKQLVRVKIASQRLIRINRDGTQTTQDYAEIYAKLCYATPYMNQPPKVGDECVLLFNDREMESWWINGSANQRAYNRMHDLTDCIAICGLRSQPKLINIYTNLVEVFYSALAKTNIKILEEKLITSTKNLITYVTELIFTKTKNKKAISEDIEEYTDKAKFVTPDLTISGGKVEYEHKDNIEKTDSANTFDVEDTITITAEKSGSLNVQFGTITTTCTTISTSADTSFTVTAPTITLTGTVGASHVDVGDGATGVFTSADGKRITVNNGIVIRIE